MSLFIRKRTVPESYSDDLDTIWTYININGEPLFKRWDLEKLWREFSEEEYSAGFISPDVINMDEFMDWLENK